MCARWSCPAPRAAAAERACLRFPPRSCDHFDYKKEVEENDMECMGIKGDGKCGYENSDSSSSGDNKGSN